MTTVESTEMRARIPKPRGEMLGWELPRNVENRKGEVVLTEVEIQERVLSLGREIAADYREKGINEITLVSILDGAMPFTTDLGRALFNNGLKVKLKSMKVSSYGDEKESSRKPDITVEKKFKPKGQHLLLVDDMIDSGNSFKALGEYIAENYQGELSPASVKTVAFLDKHEARDPELVDFNTDFVGYRVPKYWLEGYGLDTEGEFRFLTNIRVGGDEEVVEVHDVFHDSK